MICYFAPNYDLDIGLIMHLVVAFSSISLVNMMFIYPFSCE